MKTLYQIGAIIGGLIAGGLAVMGIEGISSLIYRMPVNMDINDKEAVATWIGTLPVGAFIFILVAWACGCFLAAFVARRLAPQRGAMAGLVAWLLITLATIANLLMIPHPIWVSVAGVLVCLIFGLLGLVAAAPPAYSVCCHRKIEAPISKVFRTLAAIEEFSQAIPHIKKVEFLSESRYGVGTRFRETRLMNGKEVTTELEVTELVENEYVRIVSDAGGTLWDTVFRVKQNGEAVEMNMQMDAIPHQVAAKIITPMILGMVSKFVQQDMDSVKEYCERNP